MSQDTNRYADTSGRMKPGGDLYRRPLTALEMTAPLAWHEEHMATVWRYGNLEDGTIGWLKVKVA